MSTLARGSRRILRTPSAAAAVVAGPGVAGIRNHRAAVGGLLAPVPGAVDEGEGGAVVVRREGPLKRTGHPEAAARVVEERAHAIDAVSQPAVDELFRHAIERPYDVALVLSDDTVRRARD